VAHSAREILDILTGLSTAKITVQLDKAGCARVIFLKLGQIILR